MDKNTRNKNDDAASVVGTLEISNNVFPFADFSKYQKAPLKNPKRPNFKTSNSNIFITPLAKKIALEKGISLDEVKGSGFNGRIFAKDVLAYGHPSQESFGWIQKITPIRSAIAKAMKNSWSNVAYSNLVIEVDATKLWNYRKEFIKTSIEKYGVKVSFTAFVAMATIKAIKKYPIFNSKLYQEQNVLAHDNVINLGIAVDTEKGLIVPNIKDAQNKNIIDIAKDILDLAIKARENKLSLEEIKGGTFTLTNYGTTGALFGTPVINYPELAILGMGAIQDKVYVDKEGKFYAGKSMYLTGTADHQWIDGADVGRFTSYVKELLENPEQLTNMEEGE